MFDRPLAMQHPNLLGLDELYHRGFSKVLSSFLDESARRYGAPLVVSTKLIQNWSHSCIQRAGRIAQIEHLLELVHDGFFGIRKMSNDRFELTALVEINDLEAFDVADQHFVRRFVAMSDRLWTDPLRYRLPIILDQMRKVVFVSRDYFIGYGGEPEIDNYFTAAGIAWGRTLDGQCELDGEALIGGHPFYAYRAAIAIMCGIALKHFYFAQEFSSMRPDLDPHNLVSSWSTQQHWKDVFQAALGTDHHKANDLLKALTLDPEYRDAFSTVPGAPIPPFIQVGKRDVLMSLRGCLTTPFWFVLRKLRHCYRSDWDRIVDLREMQFRDDLNQIFKARAIAVSPKPVPIRSRGRDLTDIDAAAFDPQEGILVLFQLKWQDPFGDSMRERRSRMRNIVSTANKWSELVREWSTTTSPRLLLSKLQLHRNLLDCPVHRIELVILARHHARFSRSAPRTDQAIWGTWPQLLRVIAEGYKGGSLLGFVVDALRREEERKDSPRKLETFTIQLESVEVTVSARPETE
jgi:hypothetical protein